MLVRIIEIRAGDHTGELLAETFAYFYYIRTEIIPVSTDVLHPELYARLKQWRYELAVEKELPPYTILQQKALIGVCNTLPTNSKELLKIPGIGKKIIENYGETLLEIVSSYSPSTHGNGL